MYFWISKKKAFGQTPGKNIVFGGEMPELSEDRTLDLKSKGLISEKKPETFTEAQKTSLDETIKANIELKFKNEELEKELADLKLKLESSSKAPPKKLKDSEAEIVDLKSQVKAANVKIEGLENDLDEATKSVKS